LVKGHNSLDNNNHIPFNVVVIDIPLTFCRIVIWQVFWFSKSVFYCFLPVDFGYICERAV